MSVPIFVIGFQRSGTTLLQGLLGAHPEIAAAPETHYFFRIYDLRDYYGDLGDDERLRRVVHDLLHPPIALLDDCGFDAERLLRRIRARGASYTTVLDELLRDYAERQGAARWSEKSPGQPLASVLQLFPEAQILHIVRDPVDAIASCLATSWNDRSASELAGQWARFHAMTDAAAAALPASQYLRVAYEDLVTDPWAALEGICAFLGLPVHAEQMTDGRRRMASVPSFAGGWLRRVGSPIDPSSVGRGRSVLSAAQQRAIRELTVADVPAAQDGFPVPPEERYQRTQRFFADLDRRCRA